jgi:hypothetical protein
MSMAACSSKSTTIITNSTGGYRTITEKDKLCSFSFEFSDFYEIVKPSVVTSHTSYNFVYMQLLAPKKDTSMILPNFETQSSNNSNVVTYVPATIEILTTIGWGSSSAHVDELLKDVSKWPGFNLLERSPVTVAGFSGEKIIYISNTLLPFPSSSGEEQPLQTTKAIYFNVGNDVWIIEAQYESDMEERVSAEFDHILQTFKILN